MDRRNDVGNYLVHSINKNAQAEIKNKLINSIKKASNLRENFHQFISSSEFKLSQNNVQFINEKLVEKNKIHEAISEFFGEASSKLGMDFSIGLILEALEKMEWKSVIDEILQVKWELIEGIEKAKLKPKKNDVDMSPLGESTKKPEVPEPLVESRESIARSVALHHSTYSNKNNTVQKQIIKKLTNVLCKDKGVLKKSNKLVEDPLFGLKPIDEYEILENKDIEDRLSEFFKRWVSGHPKEATIGVILDALEGLDWAESKNNIIAVEWENISGVMFNK